jgi:hypothetical protein
VVLVTNKISFLFFPNDDKGPLRQGRTANSSKASEFVSHHII